MAYGVNYRLDFCDDITLTKKRIDILKRDYSGPIIPYSASGFPLIIEYRNEEEHKLNAVTSSGAKIGLTSSASLSLKDFYSTDERGWLVRLYSGDSYPLEWSGFVIPDSASEPFLEPPYGFELRAADMLATLKDVAYSDAGAPVRKIASMKDVLCDCLGKTDLGLNLVIAVNLFEQGMNTSQSPLAQTLIDTNRFIDANGQPYSCFEVIRAIASQFGATLFQAAGKWLLISREEQKASTVNAWEFSSTGQQIGQMTLSLDHATDKDDIADADHSVLTEPAMRKVDVYYQFGYLSNKLRNGDFNQINPPPFIQIFPNWKQVGSPFINYGQKYVTYPDLRLNFRYDGNGTYHQFAAVQVASGNTVNVSMDVKAGSNQVLPGAPVQTVFELILSGSGQMQKWWNGSAWQTSAILFSMTSNQIDFFAGTNISFGLPALPNGTALTLRLYGSLSNGQPYTGNYGNVTVKVNNEVKLSVYADTIPINDYYLIFRHESYGKYIETEEGINVLSTNNISMSLDVRPQPGQRLPVGGKVKTMIALRLSAAGKTTKYWNGEQWQDAGYVNEVFSTPMSFWTGSTINFGVAPPPYDGQLHVQFFGSVIVEAFNYDNNEPITGYYDNMTVNLDESQYRKSAIGLVDSVTQDGAYTKTLDAYRLLFADDTEVNRTSWLRRSNNEPTVGWKYAGQPDYIPIQAQIARMLLNQHQRPFTKFEGSFLGGFNFGSVLTIPLLPGRFIQVSGSYNVKAGKASLVLAELITDAIVDFSEVLVPDFGDFKDSKGNTVGSPAGVTIPPYSGTYNGDGSIKNQSSYQTDAQFNVKKGEAKELVASEKMIIPGASGGFEIKVNEAGSSGGSTPPLVANLGDLGDVANSVTSSAQSNQLLRFNGITGQWENWTPNFAVDLSNFYNKSEINNLFGGVSPITGYNKGNWDAAYGWGNHAAAGYLKAANLGSFAFRNSINGNEVTTAVAAAGNDIGVAQVMRWKNYGNGHVIIDASAGTAPNGAAINRANPSINWGDTYPTLMGWNGSNTYGVRVDSARNTDQWGGYSYADNLGLANTYLMAFGGGAWHPASVDSVRSFLGLQGAAYRSETAFMRTYEGGNGQYIGYGQSMHVNNFWATGGLMTFAYSDSGSPVTGTLLSFAGNFSGGAYSLQMQSSYSGNPMLFFRTRNGDSGNWNDWRTVVTDYNLGTRVVFERGGNGAGWTDANIEIQGNNNPGIAFHWPGVQGQSLYMNVGGDLVWSGYAMKAGRLSAGYDSGYAGSVNASNWFRASGNTGLHFADYGGGVYMSDFNWVRLYGNKGLWVDNTIYSNDGLAVARDGAGSDAYAPVSVTRAAVNATPSYFGMTRAGQIAWMMGIGTDNAWLFGTGGRGSINSVAVAIYANGNLSAANAVTAPILSASTMMQIPEKNNAGNATGQVWEIAVRQP